MERLNRQPGIGRVTQKLTVPESDWERVDSALQELLKWITIGVIAFAIVAIGIFDDSALLFFEWGLALVFVAAVLGLGKLKQRGFVSETANLLLAAVTLYITLAIRPEFLTSGYALLYALPVAAAALLLTPGAGWVWAVIVTLVMLVRVMAAASNPDVIIGFGDVVASVASLYLLTWLVWFLSRSLQQSRLNLRRQINLGRTGVELGHMLTSALDASVIIRQAVRMIQEAFDYFEVGLYTLDTESTVAVLADIAGEGAVDLVEKGARVPLNGRTVLAFAINQKRPQALFSWERVKDAKGHDIEFTHKRSVARAELVIPLHMGDRVYGALDIHSTEVDAFSEGDIHTLEGIGGTLANALEGALHFKDRIQAAEKLEKAYAEVEKKVEERTVELQHETAERERLQQEVIEAQKQALLELSTPIIPVMDRIIVAPLIGAIDSDRARDITRALMAGIRQHQAEVIILDITGVSIVDSGVANYLNKTVQAARLKGARTIVTGVTEVVAETIVDLGIDWSSIDTLSDLRTGLVVALDNLGIKLYKV